MKNNISYIVIVLLSTSLLYTMYKCNKSHVTSQLEDNTTEYSERFITKTVPIAKEKKLVMTTIIDKKQVVEREYPCQIHKYKNKKAYMDGCEKAYADINKVIDCQAWYFTNSDNH